jgi:S1-C subfamily serine protease
MSARIVALDEENDLALLKVDAEQLPALRTADTGRLQSGDIVLAIGNPRNVGQSVSMGIISALWERDDTFVIQTDAAINPGNSGGALINIDGDLIGINSTIISESGGSEGIGFSTPANMALRLLEEFLASGPNGYLGVSAQGIAASEARKRFGVELQGIEIDEVVANGAAEKAGLRAGDIITGVDGQKLSISISVPENLEELEAARAEASTAIATITDRPAGELIVLDVFREGAFIQVPVILGVGVPQIFDSIEEVFVGPDSEEEATLIPPSSVQIN